MRVVVAGGTVISSKGSLTADVVCLDGRVTEIVEPGRGGVAEERINAAGCLVFPGFIDPHVHSREPGQTEKEDFAHSTRAAAAGGITTILEMPNSIPPVTDIGLFEDRARAHARTAFVDFGLWALSLGEANLGEVASLVEAGAVGVKLFWGYALHRITKQLVYNLTDEAPEDLIQPPGNGDVFGLFRTIAATGGLLAAHCEDRGLLEAGERALGHELTDYADLLAARPAAAENASVALAVEFARATGCRFHVVHMASGRSAELVRRAQAEGISITAETCPQYLTLTAEDYPSIGAIMKVYPPIRQAADRDALWDAVRDGTITSVGSDHAPHTVEQKRMPLSVQPAGAVGVETMGPLMVDAMLRGRITEQRLAWVMSEGTARLYGLHSRKGTIAPGVDADFTIVDPRAQTLIDNARLHSKHPLSPWHGRRLQGGLRLGVLRGEVVMRDGEPVGSPRGQLIRAEVQRPIVRAGEIRAGG